MCVAAKGQLTLRLSRGRSVADTAARNVLEHERGDVNLSEPPPAHDAVAMLLWHLFHFPKEEECMSFELNPMRSMLVSPLPDQEGHDFL